KTRVYRIELPSDLGLSGLSALHLTYSVPELSPEEKLSYARKGRARAFSVTFFDVLISNVSNWSRLDRIRRLRERLNQDDSPAFLQEVPSVWDVFLKIPEKARFKGSWRYVSLAPTPSTDPGLSLSLAVKPASSEKEIVVYRTPRGSSGSEQSVDLDLSRFQGVARLRLRANVTKTAGLAGYLVWKNTRLDGQKERQESGVGSGRLSRLRRFLSSKNAILIILDAARADRFSLYGHFRKTTPHIDRFAREATVFHNAHSEALTTRSSIGTLFTGLPPTATSLTRTTSQLPEGLNTLAELFRARGFRTTAYTGVGNVGSVFNFHQGFDQFFELFREKDFHRKSQEYLPYLLPWLETNRHRNFFLYIHFKEPHAAYTPLAPFRGMFSSSVKAKVDLKTYKERASHLTEDEVEFIRACYDENLASADDAFGKLVEKIKALGLLERSIVILTADHGEMLGEHGRIFGHGGYFGEPATRVPLIIRFPRLEGFSMPRNVRALVKTSDIFATLADIYELDVPPGLVSGKSLLPLM
ncbi:MAG: sulfatase, partial [Candidatus Aminicenantales bacterium]